MKELKIGDIVARKSYGYDVLFKVVDIRSDGKERIATMKGISYRIEADAPVSDLVLQSDQQVREYRAKCDRMVERITRNIVPRQHNYIKKKYYRGDLREDNKKFSKPGKVLHLDGDNDYLETCVSEYKKLGMEVVGKYVPEKNQPNEVYALLEKHRPDILVLTGHDGVIKGDKSYSNLTNYRNSRYFIEAVKEARKFDSNLDSLVIFAGACQSMFNEIIKAGANFASAPYRVLIHALDPVLVCQKVAFTSVDKVLAPSEVINSTITGVEGIGGIQTRGKYRDGFPLEPYTD